MMKRALAVALLGLGLSFTSHGPAGAAALSGPGIAAPLVSAPAPILTPVFYNGECLDVPVVGIFVAFFELLRDEEYDYHCTRRFEGSHYYRHTYDKKRHQKPYKSYK